MCKESQPAARLNLVDMLQRLGVAYHFSEEIKHELEEIGTMDAKDVLKNNFAYLALFFRLMRENCYKVPQGAYRSDNFFWKNYTLYLYIRISNIV
jgi:Terpene synthase, N-terminal domain